MFKNADIVRNRVHSVKWVTRESFFRTQVPNGTRENRPFLDVAYDARAFRFQIDILFLSIGARATPQSRNGQLAFLGIWYNL